MRGKEGMEGEGGDGKRWSQGAEMRLALRQGDSGIPCGKKEKRERVVCARSP